MTINEEAECKTLGEGPPNNRGFLPSPLSQLGNPIPAFISCHTAVLQEIIECHEMDDVYCDDDND